MLTKLTKALNEQMYWNKSIVFASEIYVVE